AQDVLDHEPGDVFDDHHAAPLSRIRATADSRCRLSVASFRSRTEPAYCTAPSRSNTTSSAISSRSLIMCVVIKIEQPCALRRSIKSLNVRQEPGSRPAVGSSRMSTDGSYMAATT